MGQRLVVTITNGEKTLCNIYYHWSAYSYSALCQTKEIVDCINNHADENESELLLRLIRFVEKEGGGIANGYNSEEWKYIQALYPNEKFKEDNISRNDGLICLSEKGIKDNQSWSEGDVEIDLEEYCIKNSVYYYYENLEEYNKERAEWDDDFEKMSLSNIPDIGCSLSIIDIDDLGQTLKRLSEVKDYVCRDGNEIYALIE